MKKTALGFIAAAMTFLANTAAMALRLSCSETSLLVYAGSCILGGSPSTGLDSFEHPQPERNPHSAQSANMAIGYLISPPSPCASPLRARIGFRLQTTP